MMNSFGNNIFTEIPDNTQQPITNLRNYSKLQQTKKKRQQQNVKNKLLSSMRIMRLRNLGSKIVITWWWQLWTGDSWIACID